MSLSSPSSEDPAYWENLLKEEGLGVVRRENTKPLHEVPSEPTLAPDQGFDAGGSEQAPNLEGDLHGYIVEDEDGKPIESEDPET